MPALVSKSHLKAEAAPVGSHLPLAHGWDTIYESYDLFPSANVITALETWKERAAADGEPLPVQIADHWFWLEPKGVRMWPWVLTDNDGRFTLRLRARAPSYGVMVEYRSAALWSCESAFDWTDLQSEVAAILEGFCVPKEGKAGPVLVSRADYAFDFYAPEFSRASTPKQFDNWSAHQEVKRRMTTGDFWGRRRIETWTLGNKKSLQLQLYDKSREISEVSGKDWMSDIHRINAEAHRLAIYDSKPVDVWRLEVRMGKDWLKRRWFNDRSSRERDVFIENAFSLLQEGLRSIQLKIPGEGGDQKTRRRPAHWMWGVASETVGGRAQRPYVARLTTGRRKALSEMFRKSAFGYLRSLSVLEAGDCDEQTLGDLLKDARESVLDDPDHRLKVERADRRYALVDRP